MIYTRSDCRRQGMAKNLIGAASALLRERGVNTMYTHIFRRNVPQVALLRRLNGSFVRTVTALPGMDLD
jgi:GNAT superfamily N-acetyltransferase